MFGNQGFFKNLSHALLDTSLLRSCVEDRKRQGGVEEVLEEIISGDRRHLAQYTSFV